MPFSEIVAVEVEVDVLVDPPPPAEADAALELDPDEEVLVLVLVLDEPLDPEPLAAAELPPPVEALGLEPPTPDAVPVEVPEFEFVEGLELPVFWLLVEELAASFPVFVEIEVELELPEEVCEEH